MGIRDKEEADAEWFSKGRHIYMLRGDNKKELGQSQKEP